eukprot:scaffold65007_cov19-Tisochrysis_lutea.AAC.1
MKCVTSGASTVELLLAHDATQGNRKLHGACIWHCSTLSLRLPAGNLSATTRGCHVLKVPFKLQAYRSCAIQAGSTQGLQNVPTTGRKHTGVAKCAHNRQEAHRGCRKHTEVRCMSKGAAVCEAGCSHKAIKP